MIQNREFLSRDWDGVKGICLCTHFSEFHFSEFSAAIFPSFDQWACCAVSRKKSKMEHSLVASSDSSVVPEAVISESPSVIVVHEARTPQPKARGGSSHMGMDKAFDKRVRVTEEQKAKTVQHWQRTGLSYLLLG